jgi:hypothetical protein
MTRSFLSAVPSWQIPGTYLENLRFLAGRSELSAVELLFFIYDAETKALLIQEWEGILEFRDRFHFTAHLPDRLLPEHEALVERLYPVVDHFIVHPGAEDHRIAQIDLISLWTERYRAKGKSLFNLENVQDGFLELMLPDLPPQTGVCMDTGHLLLVDKSPVEFYSRFADRMGEIHLHRIDRAAAEKDGRLADHRPLVAEEAWFQALLPHLSNYRGVINLEVFSWEEAEAGLRVLQMAERD